MVWLIALFIAISLVVLSQYRILGALFLTLSIVAGGLFFIFEIYEKQRSRKRIPLDQIEFVAPQIEERTRRSFTLSGRVKNHSDQYKVTGFEIVIKIKYCNNEDCITVAQETDFIRINIPSKQARDLSQNIYIYSDFNIKNDFNWDYQINHVQARE